MKLIIAGSRQFRNYPYFEKKLNDVLIVMTRLNLIDLIVSGHAPGPDRMGERYAKERNIPVKIFRAGSIRNKEMALEVGKEGHLVAFWDQKSSGTANMIDIMKRQGSGVTIIDISGEFN